LVSSLLEESEAVADSVGATSDKEGATGSTGWRKLPSVEEAPGFCIGVFGCALEGCLTSADEESVDESGCSANGTFLVGCDVFLSASVDCPSFFVMTSLSACGVRPSRVLSSFALSPFSNCGLPTWTEGEGEDNSLRGVDCRDALSTFASAMSSLLSCRGDGEEGFSGGGVKVDVGDVSRFGAAVDLSFSLCTESREMADQERIWC
jgi:hypothetical protein